jgi:trans-aconitate methyltransferase
LNYPDVSEVLRGDALIREDDTWIRLIHEKQHLARLLARVDFHSVLEIGCGTGLYAGILTKMYSGIAYTGVDSNPEALHIARRRNPKLHFIESDFRCLLHTDVDLVCAHAFLKHFSREDWLELFPKFLSLGLAAQFDMQTTSGDTFNDGSVTFGNNLWASESLFAETLVAAGHEIISSEVAYSNVDRRATIFLTRSAR